MPDAQSLAALNLPVVQDPPAGSSPHLAAAANTSAGEGEDGSQPECGRENKSNATTTKQTGAQTFVLSEGLAPVPAKLVAKILRGDFVDMAELLRDNLEADRRGSLCDTSEPSAVTPKHPRREVPDLLSWVQCFGTYMGVIASQYPDRVKPLLAYQTLIVREARRCGGRGWQSYDSMFRQQVAGRPDADWSKLNSTLYAVTFLAQAGTGRTCPLCLESDHREEECALAKARPTPLPRAGPSRDTARNAVEPGGNRSTRSRTHMICFAWNQGECKFPFCRYRHVCVRCLGDHRITQCRAVGGTDRDEPRRRDGRAGESHGRVAS